MKTVIKSETKEVYISPEHPVLLVGEKINPTGRKKLPQALLDKNYQYIGKLAQNQINAGANVLDINVGVSGLNEVEVLPEVITFITQMTDLPICIDTANPKALEAALKVTPGKPLINSVNGEKNSLAHVLPLVKEYGAAVIGLTISDDGISTDPEKRFSIAENILESAVKIGIPENDVVIDPLVMTVGADNNAGVDTLRTIKLIREKLGLNIALGASNISFGMPNRHALNQSFLTLAISAGANCMITDAKKLGMTIRGTELILSNDDFGRNYLSFYRNLEKHKKK